MKNIVNVLLDLRNYKGESKKWSRYFGDREYVYDAIINHINKNEIFWQEHDFKKSVAKMLVPLISKIDMWNDELKDVDIKSYKFNCEKHKYLIETYLRLRKNIELFTINEYFKQRLRDKW